jgi:hypothetical protein
MLLLWVLVAYGVDLAAGQATANPPCYLCGDGGVSTITKPDVIIPLPAFVGIPEASCETILTAAEVNLLVPEASCSLLDNADLRLACGCENVIGAPSTQSARFRSQGSSSSSSTSSSTSPRTSFRSQGSAGQESSRGARSQGDGTSCGTDKVQCCARCGATQTSQCSGQASGGSGQARGRTVQIGYYSFPYSTANATSPHSDGRLELDGARSISVGFDAISIVHRYHQSNLGRVGLFQLHRCCRDKLYAPAVRLALVVTIRLSQFLHQYDVGRVDQRDGRNYCT